MKNLNLATLKAVNEVFKRLNILRRWTSVTTDDKYNELAKQALNCITAYMLASVSESQGNIVNWKRFPKIALYRAFQKVYVYFDTPEHIIDEICAIGSINRDAFNSVTTDIITEYTSEDLADYLSVGIGTNEMKIYRAATKIATLVELEEISLVIKNPSEYREKSAEVQKSLERFPDIPGVSDFADPDGEIFRILLKISKLRNQNRWSVQPYSINCSVLGHLFDTAILAYLIGLEKFEGDEKVATKMFWMGIFHDLPEVWTTDIPSPIKDRIPGFRSATEQYEALVLQKYLYNKVPEYMAEKIRSVMFEEADNASLHALIKSADYLSADSECWRQYVAGSRDLYFKSPGIQSFDDALKKGRWELPPTCLELHNYFMNYASKVVSSLEI